MATTKTKKKVIVKKRAAKKVEAPVPQAVQASSSTNDVFSTEVVEVRPNSALVFINAESKGTFDSSNQTIIEFAMKHANLAGVHNFSLYANGQKLSKQEAALPASNFAKIEIVSKDSRGRKQRT